MNFFEHQDQARRITQRLLLLFGLAVLAMITALHVAVVLILQAAAPSLRIPLWHADLFAGCAAVILTIIGGGSLMKIISLNQGGQVVAQSLGGVRVLPGTTDAGEQRLYNVVEEMAIAAGIPIPTVYLLPGERGINAFAAGHTVNDAVIGVTEGCLEQLSRDELQGVIGHEFSHILNGDMALNIKLMGVLHGILSIYLMGRGLLWSRSRSGRLVTLGVAMIGIGSLGLLMGRLIKSAVSRQREFLADASAVQFTRNPDGIVNALRKIGSIRSELVSPQAEAVSHMFFSDAISSRAWGDWFATHPPLEVRLQRLGAANRSQPKSRPAMPPPPTVPALETALGFQAGATHATAEVTPEQVVTQVGRADPAHLAYARALLDQLPTELREALRHPDLSAAIVYALLLDHDEAIRDRQLQGILDTETRAIAAAVERFADSIASLNSRYRLPLLELTIPTLRHCSKPEWIKFSQQVEQLVQADGQVSLSEYVLQIILERRLTPHFAETASNSAINFTTLGQIWPDCVTLLSHLASVGHGDPKDGIYALRCGLARLPGASKHPLPEQLQGNNFQRLDEALKRLTQVTPKLKKALVGACSYTVMLDNTVTPTEAELLRGVVIAMGCPIPPFLNSIRT